MNLRLFDAHNHLQDERLAPQRTEILRALPGAGVVQMVVNGSCEADWPEVLALAKSIPQVIPSFGYHPWPGNNSVVLKNKNRDGDFVPAGI